MAGQQTPFKSITGVVGRHAELIRRLKAEHERGEGEQLVGLAKELDAFLRAVLAAGAILEDDADRMAAQTIVDYWSNLMRRAGQAAPGDELAEFDATQLPTLADVACPYPGDEPIRAGERLFGREAEVAGVLAKLERESIVAIRGPGGRGKSSLLHAGVLPRVAATQPTIVSLRPGAKPFERLAKALTQALGREVGAKQLRSAGALARLLADRPGALLAIDQFEDLFVLVSDVDRGEFDKQLAAYLAARPSNKLLVCLNDGLIDHFDWMPDTTRYIDPKQMISLEPLDAEALERAIVQPASAVELGFGPRVVEHLVRELLGDPAALPLLQFTMRALWAMPDRKNRVTLALLDRLGDPRKAFEADAEARFARLLAAAPEHALRRVLLDLVRIDARFDYHRQPCRLDQLLARDDVEAGELVRRLAEQGFVRVIDDELVELRGEAYLHHWPLLIGWIKSHRQPTAIFRDALRHTAELWAASERPNADLYGRVQLDEARKLDGLTELEKQFLASSEAAIEAEQHERERSLHRRVVVARLAVLGATLALAVLGTWTWRLGVENQRLEAWNGKLGVENEQLDTREGDLRAKTNALEADNAALEQLADELERERKQLAEQVEQLQLAAQETVKQIPGRKTETLEVLASLEREAMVKHDAEVTQAAKQGNYWLQVATDADLASAQTTLEGVKARAGRGGERVYFLILERRRHHVLLAGGYPTAEKAREVASSAEAKRIYPYGIFVRALDQFCPEYEPTGAQPKHGEQIFRCIEPKREAPLELQLRRPDE